MDQSIDLQKQIWNSTDLCYATLRQIEINTRGLVDRIEELEKTRAPKDGFIEIASEVPIAGAYVIE